MFPLGGTPAPWLVAAGEAAPRARGSCIDPLPPGRTKLVLAQLEDEACEADPLIPPTACEAEVPFIMEAVGEAAPLPGGPEAGKVALPIPR